MAPTIDELEKIKKRISEVMIDMANEQQQLDAILRYLESVEQASLHQMSESASSARDRRKKPKTKSAEEEKESYERMRGQKEESLGRMWRKIHDLQVQQRELEGKLGEGKST